MLRTQRYSKREHEILQLLPTSTKGCGWGDRTKENTVNSNAEPHKHSIFDFQLLRQKKKDRYKMFL